MTPVMRFTCNPVHVFLIINSKTVRVNAREHASAQSRCKWMTEVCGWEGVKIMEKLKLIQLFAVCSGLKDYNMTS